MAGQAGSSAVGGSNDVRICDGSPGLRFGATTTSGGGSIGEGMGLFYDLGVALYLLVNGECEYVVWRSSGADAPLAEWSPVRHGVLDESTAEELADAFAYAAWPQTPCTCADPDVYPVLGGSSLLLSNGEHRLSCSCWESAPPFGPIGDTFNEWVGRLYEQGQDLDGPLWLQVFEVEGSSSSFDGDEPDEWPLSTPAADYLDPSLPLYQSPVHVVDDPRDAASLRALRPALAARFAPDMPAAAWHENPDMLYLYVFRDVTPFETEAREVPGLFGSAESSTEPLPEGEGGCPPGYAPDPNDPTYCVPS